VTEVSIVVPAYRAPATLSGTIESLLAQGQEVSSEVIVVASAEHERDLPSLADDPRLRVLTHVPGMPAATARNRGAAVARGVLLAFADADVLAPPGWLRRMVEASDGRRCVAGSVLNGTPGSVVGTAEYVIQFLDLHPRRPVRTAWHGATCNLLLPRALFESAGAFPEDMDGGEDTVLTVALREQGLFAFAPDAPVTHLNRTGAGQMLVHQYEFGRFTAQLARRSAYKLRPLVRYWPLAPLAVAGRLVSAYGRVAAWYRGGRVRAVIALPLVIAGLTSWGAGLMAEGLRLSLGTGRR
jgi:glycosyltransferase involved in cell wall biosynthesis